MTRERVALGLLEHQGRFFAQRRGAACSRLPGLWEFPGGKVEALETPLDALLRELMEEIRWAPETVLPLPPFPFAYPDLEVEFHPFLCRGGDLPRPCLAWGWFTPEELGALPKPAANFQLVETLHKSMKKIGMQ